MSANVTIPVRVEFYGDFMVVTVGNGDRATVTAYHIGDLFGMRLL